MESGCHAAHKPYTIARTTSASTVPVLFAVHAHVEVRSPLRTRATLLPIQAKDLPPPAMELYLRRQSSSGTKAPKLPPTAHGCRTNYISNFITWVDRPVNAFCYLAITEDRENGWIRHGDGYKHNDVRLRRIANDGMKRIFYAGLAVGGDHTLL